MGNLTKELEDFFKNIEKKGDSKKSFTVKDLAPKKGIFAELFRQKYGKVLDAPATMLPCGCIYFEILNSYRQQEWIYISVCPTHQLVEIIYENIIANLGGVYA